MENYTKGKNDEDQLLLTDIPIPNIPEDVLWMKVRGGTKIRNVVDHMKKFYENKFDDICCIWTGYGSSVEKAISCAEITNRNFGYKLHQITKICYRTVQEYWDPRNPDLDQLVVTRKIPMVHIYLSSKPLDATVSGYQAPGRFISFQENAKVSKERSVREW